jgi:uncharacterized membrane protein (DUF441 family)
MNTFQLLIGFGSGLIIGAAVFSHPFSRAVVIGLVAGVIIGGIAVDGVEGYLNWAAYIPTEMAKFTTFWVAMIIGVFAGALIAHPVHASRAHGDKS